MKKASYAPIYAAALYPDFANTAKEHGYALAVHGSLARDFDLIAVPWKEKPSTPEEVVKVLKKNFSLEEVGKSDVVFHGRRRFTLSVGFGECFVDLSFMPVLDH